MAKYNLTNLLNEYIGGGRIGTLNISFRDLVDKMEELEKSGEVIVREKDGQSGDGKVNREFEVVDRDSAVPGGNKQERGFTVYDYKFGFDPGDVDNYDEEYDFSIGGQDLDLAMKLIDGVRPYNIDEVLGVKSDDGTEDNVDNIDKVASPGAKAKDYDSAIGAERSEDSQESSNITQTTKPMYTENGDVDEYADELDEASDRIIGDAFKAAGEMKMHLKQYRDGNIDGDDLANAFEEIIFGDVKAPGMEEVMGIDRKGNKKPDTDGSDATKFKKAAMSEEEMSDDEKRYTDAAAKMIKDRILKDIPMDIIVDFVKTHGSDIRRMNNSEIKDEFEEFRSVNYDYIDEDLKSQFKRFM